MPNLHRRYGYERCEMGQGVVPGALKNTKMRIKLYLLDAGDLKGKKTQGNPPSKKAKTHRSFAGVSAADKAK